MPGLPVKWPVASTTVSGCGATGVGGAVCFSRRATFESVIVALTRPTASNAPI
jgi:hypothetical protein